MNHPNQTPDAWQWGLDATHSEMALRLAEDEETVRKMANDVIAGTVKPHGLILSAFSTHARLPLDAAHRLAKAFPDHDALAQELCMRPDVTAEILHEFADNPAVFNILVIHEKLDAKTADRLLARANPTGHYYYDLFDQISQSLLATYASSDDCIIRVAVARNLENATALIDMTSDSHPRVRSAAFSNPHTPMPVVNEAAVHEENFDVLACIARRLTDPVLLETLSERLLGHRHKDLVQAILDNPHSSDIAKTVAVMAQ